MRADELADISRRVDALAPVDGLEGLVRAVLPGTDPDREGVAELLGAISGAFALAAVAMADGGAASRTRAVADACLRASSSESLAGTDLSGRLWEGATALYEELGLPVPSRAGAAVVPSRPKVASAGRRDAAQAAEAYDAVGGSGYESLDAVRPIRVPSRGGRDNER